MSLLHRGRRRTRGQTVVEFALILPALVLMLLIALDFGRAFLGWVSLNNAARVGANYAASNPNDPWGPGSKYQTLMADNMDAINCTPNPAPAAPPVFGASKDPGEMVRVNLSCDFSVLTPVIGQVLGNIVTVSSTATFPITYGCIADCAAGPGAPPPPPPANNCRTVPNVVDLSVAGAREAWVAAGFSASNFIPSSGQDTRTVEAQAVSEPANDEGCTGSQRYFASTMTVTVKDIEPVTAGCFTVPDLRGVSVAAARAAWSVDFTGAFLPTDSDTRRVTSQVTDAPSDPGDCMPPTTSVIVSHAAPYPAPPPQPCKVPSFINTSSSTATASWTAAGFKAANISFDPKGGTFQIVYQSLVGGTFISCDAPITVSHKVPK